MARFDFGGYEGASTVRPYQGKGALIAFFDFKDTELGLRFRAWRLFTRETHLWVCSPSDKPYEDKDGNLKYPSFVEAYWDEKKAGWNREGKGWLDDLAESAYEEYQRIGGGHSSRPSRSKSAPRALREAPSAPTGGPPKVRRSRGTTPWD